MIFNTDFYEKKEESISEKEKELINNYIENSDDLEYENRFPEKITAKEVYHLSSSSQNILNWYPFKATDTVLEIGGNLGNLTEIFVDKCKEVTTIEPNFIKAKAISKRYSNRENLEVIVGNFLKIKLNKKFDYIVLIGSVPRVKEIMGQDMKLDQMIQELEKYLKDEGKFLIAVDNKFGLRYFVGNPDNILNRKFQSIIGYSNEPEKIETFTKSRLERKLKEIGYYTNFYYPLPDYKIPNVIFSDRQLPQYNSVDKYNPYYLEKSTILMNEIDVFREILKNNEEMFTFFTNSFLVEASKKNEPIKYKYISFNNMRKQKYRLVTKISDEYVEKQVVNELANEHYENIKKNIKQLQEQNIKTLDYEKEGKIQSKYVDQELLLNNVIAKALEEKNEEKVEKIIDLYIETLNINSYQEQDYEKTVFGKYNIEIENKDIIRKLHFQKRALWDMTFKNCFYINGELYFFDQEWAEDNLPTEYILYRSILYTISLRRFVNIEELFEKYGLQKYRKIFEELDNKMQEKIRDNKMWEFYNQNKYFDIDATIQEVKNLNIRNKAQQGAIDNLQKEKNQIQKEYEEYRKMIEQRLSSKIRKKIEKILRREKEN